MGDGRELPDMQTFSAAWGTKLLTLFMSGLGIEKRHLAPFEYDEFKHLT